VSASKHGTFQFFTEAIGNRTAHTSRFQGPPHHTETIKQVLADPATLGFVPYATVKDFDSQVRAISIDFARGPCCPGPTRLQTDAMARWAGRCVPLSEPLRARQGPGGREFVKFLLSDLEKYVGYANLTTLPSMQYQEAVRRVSFATDGCRPLRAVCRLR
jgi:hypothetical protein